MPHSQSILICTYHTWQTQVWEHFGMWSHCPPQTSKVWTGSLHGPVILECTNMYPGGYPKKWNLDTIWDRFEDFCKLQSNELHAQFDLLTSFHQGNKSLDEWYNVVQAQVNLARYPSETAKILHHNIFWIFVHDKDFVLAKKFKSSKATVCHIKQVAGDLQATQINLMWHQRTELPTNRHNKKRRTFSRPNHNKINENAAANQVKKSYDNKKPHRVTDWCNKCGESIHAQGFQCPAKKYQCKVCNKYGHFSSLCYQKKPQNWTIITVAKTLKHTNYMQVPCMHKTVLINVNLQNPALMNHSA